MRKLMGYVRDDSEAALTAMNDVYADLRRRLQNLFLPSVKLQSKNADRRAAALPVRCTADPA